MFTFTKTRRLLNKHEYSHVFEKSKKIVTTDFIVFFRENNLEHARLGFAVSKKMLAKAHDRNRAKRLIRESFRQKQLPNYDLIFLAKSGITKQLNSVITKKLSKIWDHLIAHYEK